MSTPCESKYTCCEIHGCNKVPCSYGHQDERYCPEHEEEYEKFKAFMFRFEEED